MQEAQSPNLGLTPKMALRTARRDLLENMLEFFARATLEASNEPDLDNFYARSFFNHSFRVCQARSFYFLSLSLSLSLSFPFFSSFLIPSAWQSHAPQDVAKRSRPSDLIRRSSRGCSSVQGYCRVIRVFRAFHYFDGGDSRSTLNIAVYCRGRAGNKIRGGWR